MELHPRLPKEAELLQVGPVGAEEGFFKAFAEFGDGGGEVLARHHLADEGVAVGVGAGGGEGEERVPFPHPLGPEDAAPLHHAHQGAGDIPGAFPVDAGHLGGFPLRGDAVRAAGLGQGGEEGGQHPFVQVACRQVVQEEKGLRPWARRSLTEWLTRSKPSPETSPASRARRVLVPTPSVVATKTGSSRALSRLAA